MFKKLFVTWVDINGQWFLIDFILFFQWNHI